MSESKNDPHEGLAQLKQSKHGLQSIGALVVAAIIGLLVRQDVIFGLVMGTVAISGLGAGQKTIAAIKENVPKESMQPAIIVGPVVAAIIAGIIATIIITVVRSVVGEESFAIGDSDNVIVQIVKHFFDHGAAIAVGIGLLAGAWGNKGSD